MLGLFDSGRGGLNTVGYLKRTGEDDDLVYLIDRENAPYGIKTEQEILEITKRNVKALTGMGARAVLIACCTASTVHHLLPDEEKRVSIPIIDAVAKEARAVTRTGKIGVIATDRTVNSGAFTKALLGLSVTELALGGLVAKIDKGLCDLTVTRSDIAELEDMLTPILRENIDTLILGCTHFPAIYDTVKGITEKYGDISVIDSAKIGAEALIKYKRK
jgi:glutamate racemase